MNAPRLFFSALLLGLPLLVTWILLGDLGGYPSNDDPFYGRPAQIFAQESRYQVIRQGGELSASSALHVVIGGAAASIFGFSYRVLFAAVLMQLWLAAIGIYAMSRTAGCSPVASLFLAAVFLLNPLVFGHGFTFMTDGPAMAWFVAALLCFQRGLRGEYLGWLCVGSLAAGAAFWMRQTHVIAIGFPLAALAFLLVQQRTWKSSLAAMVACTLPAMLAVLLFESGWIVFGDGARVDTIYPEHIDLWQLLINVYGVALLHGFLLLPLLPLLCRTLVQRVNRERAGSWFPIGQRLAALTIAAMLLIPLLATRGRAVLTSATGSFLQNAHLGPVFLSDFEMPQRWGDMGGVSWPAWIWQLLTVLSILNFGLISYFFIGVARSWWKPTGENSVHAATTFGLAAVSLPILLTILFVSTGVLDRYWMLLLPVVVVLLAESTGDSLRFGSIKVACLSCLLLIAQFSVSVVLVRDFLVWNQTRWVQYEQWLAQGYSPRDIDGGRDMNAWYRSAEDVDTQARPGDTSVWWSGHAKLAMAIGTRKGWREIGQLSWKAWATGREHNILILEKEAMSATGSEAQQGRRHE